MKKRIFLSLIFAIIVAGGVFAQTQNADSRRNWISGEAGLIGAGLRYERMLGNKVSIGGNFLFWGGYSAALTGRFYPWGKTFYTQLAVGFFHQPKTEIFDITINSLTGLMAAPGAGWKIDVGLPGAFFLNPHIEIPFVIGKSKPDAELAVGIDYRILLGMGYAF